VAYQWQRSDRRITFQMTGSGTQLKLLLPLPAEAPEQMRVEIDGVLQTNPSIVDSGKTRYVVLNAPQLSHRITVEW